MTFLKKKRLEFCFLSCNIVCICSYLYSFDTKIRRFSNEPNYFFINNVLKIILKNRLLLLFD